MEARLPISPIGDLVVSVDEESSCLALTLDGVPGHWSVPSFCRQVKVMISAIGSVQRVEVAPTYILERSGREISIIKCGHPVGTVNARSLALAVALVTGRGANLFSPYER